VLPRPVPGWPGTDPHRGLYLCGADAPEAGHGALVPPPPSKSPGRAEGVASATVVRWFASLHDTTCHSAPFTTAALSVRMPTKRQGYVSPSSPPACQRGLGDWSELLAAPAFHVSEVLA
jgi:hypothetical protein